jgi:L-alanine-DL-glutamate epimerase-like enolase superfamily enzyme
MSGAAGPPVDGLDVAAYTVPTDGTESDGTLEWDSTTIVVVHCRAGGRTGLGYTYGSSAVSALVSDKLATVVSGMDVFDVGAAWHAMGTSIRNVGRPGIGMMAVAAVDIALWDLKAKLLGLPLVHLLPAFRDRVPVYGSGGFTSYSLDRLQDQLGGWVEQGIPRVKMKVGRDPAHDPARLDAARKGIGDQTELFVDANGAFTPRAAVEWANRYHGDWDVRWFEEPVSSADIGGLRFVRDHAPGAIDVAAGEYAFVLADFRNLVEGGAVDCLQADVTRCGGITGLLQAGGLAAAHQLDVSGHCAPAISTHPLCAMPRLRHLEYFHDHVRLERMLFDGTPELVDGCLQADLSRPGHGLELKAVDAEPYRVRPS